MSQVSTKSTRIKTVIHTRHFIIGYNDAIRGMPFNEDYDKYNSNEQWNYERGRLYAIASNGSQPPKYGKRVNYRAINLMSELVNQGAIV